MKQFTTVHDVGNVEELVNEGLACKKNPFSDQQIGKNKTLGLVFFNSSLRTRLSTQKAAKNLGMDVMIMNIDQDGYGLVMDDGVVMDGVQGEHVKEGAAVMAQYCDIIGVRSFSSLQNREDDYSEKTIKKFMEFSGVPFVSLESATLHPLQSLTDLITIKETLDKPKPKVVLSWAPHVKALPQAVANSFSEWIRTTDADFMITHPKGYELDKKYTGDTPIEYDQEKAFQDADLIYTKNWCSYTSYGKILNTDSAWMIDKKKMDLTNNARFMHCLPVRRNVVVADEVLDSDQSIVVQQAGNRVWAAQAVLKKMLQNL